MDMIFSKSLDFFESFILWVAPQVHQKWWGSNSYDFEKTLGLWMKGADMSISKQYTQELRDHTNYSGTWLPTIQVSPGEVGRIEQYQYQRLTTLQELGIPFQVTPGHIQADVDYTSSGAVSLAVKVAGQVPLPTSALTLAEAGVHIQFSRQNAVVFRAAGCASTTISNRLELEKEIINRYQAGNWEKEWVVIMEVVSAASATILIASGSGAKLDLRAGGQLSAAQFNLADVEAGFEVAQESNIATRIVAASQLTPLFKAAGIQTRIFRPGVVVRGGAADLAFGSLDYEDFDIEEEG